MRRNIHLMQAIDNPDHVLEAVLAFYEDLGEAEPHATKSDEDRMFYL